MVKQFAKRAISDLAYAGFGAWGLRRSAAGRCEAPDLKNVRSILVIRLNLMGDVIFTLPAIAALRAAAPRARITALVLPYTAEVLRGSKLVDRVVTVDVNRWRRLASWLAGRAPREIQEAVSEVRQEPYDLCISFYGQAAAAMAILSGARYAVGYESEGYPRCFDLALPGKRYESGRHEAEYCMDLVRALGVSAAVEPAPRAQWHEEETRENDALLASTWLPDTFSAWEPTVDRLLAEAGVEPGQGVVVIHPGALNMAAKRWFATEWAVVADRIQRELGRRAVLAGSISELALVEAVRREMWTKPVSLAGKTSIPELAALLKRCDLFLGGDSGPLHLASALGVPSVSIYGPTDPANSGPLGANARVLRGSAECIPCYDLGRPAACWRGDLLCMSQVHADQVFEAAREMLEHRSPIGPHPDPLPEGEGGSGEALAEGEGGSGEALAEGEGGSGEALAEGEGGSGEALAEGEGSGQVVLPQDSGLRTQHSAVRTQNPEPRTQNPELITHHSSLFKRILVVKLAGIGDLLTSFPALEALRRRYPHAEITALVTPQSASLLYGAGLVDRVMEMDKYLFDGFEGFTQLRSLVGLIRLSRELRARSFDAVVLLHHLVTVAGVAKYALLTIAAGAGTRAGLDDGRGRFLNLTYPDRGFGAMHEVDYWLGVVGLLDATNPSPRVSISWNDDEERFASEKWREIGLVAGERVVAIHPGTGSYSPARRWHPERFSAVGASMAQDGLVPLVVAGPGEESLGRQVGDGIAPGTAILSGTPTPRHLAAVLSRCSLFVGNDSGVTHVASAVGIPVVAVFGPSNHRAWGPYDPDGSRTRIVRVDLPCSPCLYRGHSLGLRYGCGDFQCLDRISPESVIAAARDLLDN